MAVKPDPNLTQGRQYMYFCDENEGLRMSLESEEHGDLPSPRLILVRVVGETDKENGNRWRGPRF